MFMMARERKKNHEAATDGGAKREASDTSGLDNPEVKKARKEEVDGLKEKSVSDRAMDAALVEDVVTPAKSTPKMQASQATQPTFHLQQSQASSDDNDDDSDLE